MIVYARINVVIMTELAPASLDTMVKTVKIALKDISFLMLWTVTKYVLVSILLDQLGKHILFQTFYITEYTCDEGFFVSITNDGQLNCKGEKFNENLTKL